MDHYHLNPWNVRKPCKRERCIFDEINRPVFQNKETQEKVDQLRGEYFAEKQRRKDMFEYNLLLFREQLLDKYFHSGTVLN